MSVCASESGALGYQGSAGVGSFSPAATRFLYSAVVSHALPVREMAAAFLADTSGLPAMSPNL